jgi:glycerol-3-phosphate acyltransferase PlsY
VFCGLLAFVGHMFPVYLRFKGGKGVATGLGVALALNWMAALAAFGVWVLVLIPFRYVALSSVAGGIALPIAHLLLVEAPFGPDRIPITFFFLLGALFIVIRHLSNLRRIAQGEEPRVLSRAK